MSSSDDHKSSSEDRKSWDTLRYSSNTSEMSDQGDVGLEEFFERVENALKNQLNHLRSLGEAVNAIERDEVDTSTLIRRRPLPDSGAVKLSRREKLWKEGRRDLYRFMEEFEERISARSFHHLRNTQASRQRAWSSEPRVSISEEYRDSVVDSTNFDSPMESPIVKTQAPRQRVQSPEPRPSISEEYRDSVVDPTNFDSPRESPKPIGRYGKSGCFSPAPLTRKVRTSSPVPQPDPRPPTPPVPERHPSRRTSQVHSPTGSVMLVNTPANFVTNMLPEEHVKLAKEKQRESMARALNPDVMVRRGSNRTQDSVSISPTSSYNVTPVRSPHHSRSASSLRLAAVVEERATPAVEKYATPTVDKYATPPGLIPLILTSSLRQTSRIPRPAPLVPYHTTTLSNSLASKDFYDGSPKEKNFSRPDSRRPDSHQLYDSLPRAKASPRPDSNLRDSHRPDYHRPESHHKESHHTGSHQTEFHRPDNHRTDSHLPPAMRSSSSLFAPNLPEPDPTPIQLHDRKRSEPETDELQSAHIHFVREKLTRDRRKAEMQWNEANRMLQGLPAIGDEGALPRWPTLKPRERTRPRRATSEGGEGYKRSSYVGEETLKTRIMNLWKTGTKKGGRGAR